MTMPGAADPHFYEWYVGLEKVIKMLNPESGINHVIFQHDEYDTIDDIVVSYDNGETQVCYQVKHNIGTAAPNNLTFGSMLEVSKGKKCLFEAMFLGWKKASASSANSITPILFTNRRILSRRSGRHLNGQPYSAYAVDDFISKIKTIIHTQTDKEDLTICDESLRCQWEELCNTLSTVERKELMDFIKHFRIEGNQPSLGDMKQSLVDLIAQTFGCNDGIALELFSKLLLGLTDWTTTERKNRAVVLEDVYSVLSIETDLEDSQHKLAHPYPFFDSRKVFCKELVKQIKATKNKVVFISGNPGSGKTSVVSFMQSEYSLFELRYHTFRPISPEQRFYNTDPGMCTTKNLWGTLLIQLRKKLKGHLAEYGVPVSNQLIADDKLRDQVIRLLGILAKDAIKNGERVYVCIDGIDHAARANTEVSFLDSLPTPEEIPEGVCFIIVGQPNAMYQEKYPLWLSTSASVERVDIPLLNVCDIKQLIMERAKQFEDVSEDLAKVIHQKTEGNNLSAVFAVEEIRSSEVLESAIDKLNQSGICGNIQQYYDKIWSHMKKDLSNFINTPVYPESIIACPLLLMNGKINTRILSQAITCGMNKNDWSMVLNRLYPLIIKTDTEDEYALFHNDFRVFLMGVISPYQPRYKEIALVLAEHLLQSNEGLLSYTLGIPLLQCAERQDLIPKYFTPEFIINALSEGVAKTRLDEFAHLSYSSSCDNKDFVGYRNTYLAIKTLHQHIRYYEYYDKSYKSTDYPEICSIDINEIRALPVSIENIDAFKDVLVRCSKLYFSSIEEYKRRAIALYQKWFKDLSPLSFVPLLPENITNENAWEVGTSEIGLFLQHWGKVAAELNIILPNFGDDISTIDLYALVSFGNAYFTYCIEHRNYELAKKSIESGCVTQKIFSEKLEEIYYAETASEFEKSLHKLEHTKEDPELYLLAHAMIISFNSSYIPNPSILQSATKIKHLYDKNSFALVLKAFLLGRIKYNTNDDELIRLSDQYCSEIEDSAIEKSQMFCLTRTAVLLGKYYWNNNLCSTKFEGYAEWLLTTNLIRSFDYSKARRFLLFSLLHSQAVCSIDKTDNFITALRTNLFEIDFLGMFYKTDILNFLVKQNKLEIVKEYIEALYGENCNQISKEEHKFDMHERFHPYGDLVAPELVNQFTEQLKWDVVGYLGYKEYAMYAPLECYKSAVKKGKEKWCELGKALYKQSKLADLFNNRASYDIDDILIKKASSCGISDYWLLREWDNAFKLKPDHVYNALLEFANNANKAEDLKAIWLLCCGIHSWYTQPEQQGAKCVYDACLTKSTELDFDFRFFVLKITPSWMSIIDHMFEKDSEIDSYSEHSAQRTEERNAIHSFHRAITLDESIDFLTTVETERDADEHYHFVFDRILETKADNTDELSKFLGSFCVYLKGKSWAYEKYDVVITTLLSNLNNEAFWSLAKSIYSQLSDYDYQTSMRNMELLLKLNSSLDSKEIETLFYDELRVQELWVTGNGHFEIDSNDNCITTMSTKTPSSFSEMAFYILLEQISTQNARKMESAIYSIYLLGLEFPQVMDIIVEQWQGFSQNQIECLLLILAKWAVDGALTDGLCRFIRDVYENCSELSRKYYLHSILLKMKVSDIDSDVILYNAPENGYTLPKNGIAEAQSSYENFLSTIEHTTHDKDIDAIRKYIFEISPIETYINDPYAEDGDSRLPTTNLLPGNVFYDKEKSGTWSGVSLSIKKARLLPIEDPFLLTEMPHISFDEEWFPKISVSSDDRDREYLTLDELNNIVNYNIDKNEIVLAACLWYPWGYKDGRVYVKTSKIGIPHDSIIPSDFDRCVGNFGLLANENAIDGSRFSEIGNGGISLFNRMCGNLKINFGNCQLAPSSAWRDIFKCSPMKNNPYIWLDESENQALRFERTASPTLDLMRQRYIRQPMLFRWICDKEWLKSSLNQTGLILFNICSQENYPSFTE